MEGTERIRVKMGEENEENIPAQ